MEFSLVLFRSDRPISALNFVTWSLVTGCSNIKKVSKRIITRRDLWSYSIFPTEFFKVKTDHSISREHSRKNFMLEWRWIIDVDVGNYDLAKLQSKMALNPFTCKVKILWKWKETSFHPSFHWNGKGGFIETFIHVPRFLLYCFEIKFVCLFVCLLLLLNVHTIEF